MDSYVKLHSLTERREQNLGDTFQRMAERLGKTGEHALLQIRILSGAKHLYWCLELDEYGTRVKAEKVDHPDFEIVTQAASGSMMQTGPLP